MNSRIDRRDFLRTSAAIGVGAAVTGGPGYASLPSQGVLADFRTPPMKKVRMGFIGVGNQGEDHVRNFLNIDNVEIKAICDIVESKVAKMQEWAVEAGKPKPEGYSRGDFDFMRMDDRDDLDLVFIATPWRWHVPMCVDAMEKGKHAATEVPAAITLDECWQLVETAEKYKKHCVMMENCCYDRAELQILNMVRKGVLGELLHAECGYMHDLRALKYSSEGEGLWRLAHSVKRDANLYPTHGLGPVAQCMDINRGDQFDYLVSMSSPSKGLNLFAAKEFGSNDARARRKYALGDINTSLIKTKKGLTIVIKHETDGPRPYSRDILVQGTKGLARKYPEQLIHIEGVSPEHKWEPLEKYSEAYEHPLWKTVGKEAGWAGHGGMDYIEDYRLIECLLNGEPTDMDVYDAAALSAVIELSEISVANKSKAVDFPDFTRGAWKTRAPLGIIGG